ILARAPRLLKPLVLIGGMVEHEFNNYAESTIMRGFQKSFEIFESTVAGMHRVIIRNVVAIIAQGGWEKGHEPERVDSEFLKIVELLREAGEITDAIVVA